MGKSDVTAQGAPQGNGAGEPLKREGRGIKSETIRCRQAFLPEKLSNARGAAPRHQQTENDKNQDKIPGHGSKIEPLLALGSKKME